MTTSPAIVNFDAWANEAKPGENNGKDATLLAEQGTGVRKWVYMRPTLPWPAKSTGITVLDAKLRVVLAENAPGGGDGTLLCFRIETNWGTKNLKWSARPTTVTNSDASAIVPSGAVKGTVIELNVTAAMQAVADGALYTGFNLRLSSAATRGPYKFGAGSITTKAYQPTLDINWVAPPGIPTSLVPSGGRWVSTRKPMLSWVFGDVTDEDAVQSGFQVQVDDVEAFTTPDYDSGTIPSGTSQLDLASTAYAGLPTDGSPRFWRVRVVDQTGVSSAWSAAQRVRYCPLGSVTISAPGTTTPDLRPSVTWSFAPPALPTGIPSTAQASWQAKLQHFETERGVWVDVADSGMVSSTETTWTSPRSLPIVGDSYRFVVYVRGPLERQALAGAADRATQTKAFTWTPAGAITNPAALVATIVDDVWVDLTWTRATRPDHWALVADGIMVADDIDVAPTGTAYAWRWHGAIPRKAHALRLHAVEVAAGVPSYSSGTTVTAETDPIGIWLVDAADNRRVHIAGTETLGASIGERSTLLPRIGRRDPVLVTEQVEGYVGDIGGTLVDWNGLIARDMRRTLIDIREHSSELRLILGDLNLPVLVWDVEANPTPDIADQRFVCSFSFAQSGEFERL